MKARRVVLLALIASLAAREARAEDPNAAPEPGPDFGRSGAYIGVGASRSVNLIEDFLSGTPILGQVDVSNSWGVNGRVGYQLTSWFAAEAEYEWLQPFNASLGGVHVGTVGLQTATVNLRLILPTWRFQPYFLLGAGALFTKVDTRSNQIQVDHSAFAGRVGLGLDVYVTQNLLLNGGIEGVLSPAEVKLNTGTGSVSENGLGTLTFQIGLGWRF